jgi:hypothetical protein
LSQATWYSLDNCNILASYVINVGGSGDVVFQGDRFPTVIERVVYNIEGSGRYVNVTTGIGGNILAPNNILYQTNGVTRGLVVFGDVQATVQNNKPNCQHFDAIVIVGKTNGDIVDPVSSKRNVEADSAKYSYIPVASFGSFAVGDIVTIGGQNVTIVGGAQQGSQLFLVVSPQISNYPSGTSFSTTINDPSSVTTRPQINPTMDVTSSASSVVACLLVVVCAVLAAF